MKKQHARTNRTHTNRNTPPVVWWDVQHLDDHQLAFAIGGTDDDDVPPPQPSPGG